MTSASSTRSPTIVDPLIITAPLEVAPAQESDDQCDVCGHPGSNHDTIASRYCAATFANVLSRGCICPTPRP